MSTQQTDIQLAAQDYDSNAEEYGWRGPDVAFGLAYEFVSPGESILDIGIGTGLGSVLFCKSGLRVFGMDNSAEMLEVCGQKGFATDLKKHDLANGPYPYDAASLDHAICIGVLDFIEHTRLVFSEVSRLLRDRGIFVFTVADRGPSEGANYTSLASTESEPVVTMYRRSADEVHNLLKCCDFDMLKSLEFFAYMDPEKTITNRIRAYAARRIVRV